MYKRVDVRIKLPKFSPKWKMKKIVWKSASELWLQDFINFIPRCINSESLLYIGQNTLKSDLFFSDC